MSNEETKNEGILQVGTKATISWLDKEGNETGAERCPRSLPSILETLEAAAAKGEEQNVRVYLRMAKADEDGKPTTVEAELTSGTIEEAIEDIKSRVMPPDQALLQFHLTVSKLMDLSALKGAMVTAVFGDGQATGFAVLSESIPVEETDVKVLGAAATAQAEEFKHKMRETLGITFPDDSGGIVLPGNARHLNLKK